jgi:hypothetical protein
MTIEVPILAQGNSMVELISSEYERKKLSTIASDVYQQVGGRSQPLQGAL